MVVYQVVQPHAHAVSDIQTTDPTSKSHSVIAEDVLRRDLGRFESSCEMAVSIFLQNVRVILRLTEDALRLLG
jgi:hypothetical protein